MKCVSDEDKAILAAWKNFTHARDGVMSVPGGESNLPDLAEAREVLRKLIRPYAAYRVSSDEILHGYMREEFIAGSEHRKRMVPDFMPIRFKDLWAEAANG